MRFTIPIYSEYRATSCWEKLICIVTSPQTLEEAQFCTMSIMGTERAAEAFLAIKIHRAAEQFLVGGLKLGINKLAPWTVKSFDIDPQLKKLQEGDVLTLCKDTVKTRTLSLPESLVQVELS